MNQSLINNLLDFGSVQKDNMLDNLGSKILLT